MKITVNGNALYYRFDGPKDAPVVMMAHAMGTSHRIWDWQMAALSDRWRVLRYDWLGHGDSAAPPGPYSLDGFVADAVGLMDALAIPKVHWVGISTGGMIGQGMGITHGDRLQSLSLCNTTPQATPWYREWVAERQAVVRKDGMPPVWDMTKRLWFTDAFVDAESPVAAEVPPHLAVPQTFTWPLRRNRVEFVRIQLSVRAQTTACPERRLGIDTASKFC